jgi:hypothetical protein
VLTSLMALLERMKADPEQHLARLRQWKAAGGQLGNYPEHKTVDDFIRWEEVAVTNLIVLSTA